MTEAITGLFAMLLLSFIAVSSGCLILALDLFFRRMPLPLKP